MRKAEFNFTSEDHISKQPRLGGVEYRVSLSVFRSKDKDGKEKVQHMLRFPREVIHIHDLAGKRLKFYVDAEKKAIAWRVMEGATTLDELNTGRVVNPDKHNGSWATGMSKLLNHAKIDLKESRSKIPVETYQTTEMLVPMKYWYIRL